MSVLPGVAPGRPEVFSLPGIFRTFAVSCLLACIPAAPANARTWLVPAEAPSIAAGLDSSAAGDTVLVSCGTYAETGLALPDAVTLRGATGLPGCVTIDGQDLAPILDVAHTGTSTRIEGITFTGGRGPTSGATNFARAGGALRCDSAFVEVTDCAFLANQAKFGGAVALFGPGGATFTRCDFDSNMAADSAWATGGALWAEQSDPVLADCSFTGNTAFSTSIPGDGGAVFADYAAISLTDCTFLGNASGAGGGAFYSFSFDVSSLTRCTFRQNASGAGAAAYVETAQPTFRDCSFTDNEASNGGAIFCGQFGGAKFTDCAFDSNRAVPSSGGACDIWQSSPTFTRCSFRFNSATARGGAASVNGGSGPNFTDCLFRANSATDGGAVRATSSATPVLTGCNVVANSATSRGGGLFCEGQSLAIVDRSLVVFSTAGPAVECAGSGAVDITCSNLFGNTGGDWIGCVAGKDSLFGNLSADPLFCDAAGGVYTVRLPDSPCLPENNSCGQVIGFEGGGCGCPASATILVPGDQPTIAAALAAAAPGDTVGVCDGTFAETVDVVSGVHILGVRPDLCTVTPGASPEAVVRALHVADSTWIAGLTIDGQGLVPDVVLVDSASTGLHLRADRITGGAVSGIRNGPDSRVRVGGSLAWANDLFGNGTSATLHLVNENAADSVDATVNWWGTTRYDSILTFVQGPVRTCPITNQQHADSLCAPVSATPVPPPAPPRGALTLALGPNPFHDLLRVFLTLPAAVPARITVHDVAGRRVRTLLQEPLAAGAHAVAWTGRDEGGRAVAPGVYFLRLEAGSDVRTRKVVLLR